MRFRYLIFLLWFVAISGVIAALGIGHWFALPHPEPANARLVAGIREIVPPERWATVHVLYTECRCSQRIVDHLMESPRPVALAETVVLVGPDHELGPRLSARGYRVIPTTPEALLARFGIESAPVLVVVDDAGRIRYVGGYTRRQQGPDIADLAIVRDLQANAVTTELPVFGCAVSRRLAELADPLTLKR